jgi:hypothetical protein
VILSIPAEFTILHCAEEDVYIRLTLFMLKNPFPLTVNKETPDPLTPNVIFVCCKETPERVTLESA